MNDLLPARIDGTLEDLASRINAAHEQCEQALRAGLAHALEAGQLLLEAKAKVRHGEWLPWLEANVCFSERTAQGYMRAARRWPELQAKAQRVADLPLREAMALLTSPLASAWEEWRETWHFADVCFLAATVEELKEALRGYPFQDIAPLPAENDEAEWQRGLIHFLAEAAAGYLVRTGKILPPPPQLVTPNVWELWVHWRAGRFLNWCDEVGVRRVKGYLALPDRPNIDKLKVSLAGELQAGDETEDEAGAKLDDRALAEVLGVSEDDLPEALVCWMRGRFYSFGLTKSQQAELAESV